MMRPHRLAARARGFTLVELIIVLMITSIIGVVLAKVIPPAFNSYIDQRTRADLTDQADTALRRMLRDVRRAVPNSIRIPSDQCFELVPSASGGRYRMDIDTTCSGCSMALDTSQATTTFDVLTTLQTTPAVGDWVVVDNQNSNDVYAGNNRSALTAVATPVAAAGRHRLTVGAKQFPTGYNGGRLMIVANSQQSVFYICSGADGTVDAQGNGKGTLYRLVRGFNSTYPASCPATTGADVVATRVKSCTFVYDPNQGATQQSGFVWTQIALSRNNESAMLAEGAHVSNLP
jgi:MSHA biogenesis protein MshO